MMDSPRVIAKMRLLLQCDVGLLGVFDINMSLSYNERDKAFFRLQEIAKTTRDQSLFAWVYNITDLERTTLVSLRSRHVILPPVVTWLLVCRWKEESQT